MYDYTPLVGTILLAGAFALAVYAHRIANRKDHHRG